jgi:hypothetical protein
MELENIHKHHSGVFAIPEDAKLIMYVITQTTEQKKTISEGTLRFAFISISAKTMQVWLPGKNPYKPFIFTKGYNRIGRRSFIWADWMSWEKKCQVLALCWTGWGHSGTVKRKSCGTANTEVLKNKRDVHAMEYRQNGMGYHIS